MNSSTIVQLGLLLVVAAIFDGVARVQCNDSLQANTWENYLIFSKGQAMLGNELLAESRPRYARRLKQQVDFVNRKRLDVGTKVGLGGAMLEAFSQEDGPADGVKLGYQYNIMHPGTELNVDPAAFKPSSLMGSLAAGAFAKAKDGGVRAHQIN